MSASSEHATPSRGGDRTAALALGAVGVVYGDIGTSPLYTLKEVFSGHLAFSEANVLGILSLVFWSLVVVVTAKYVFVVMRADNRGEGGVLALSALAQRGVSSARGKAALACLGMLGMALFTGDSLITPAISVLSAVEGLNVAAPALGRHVIPITLGVLTALFAIQRWGTELVGRLFGPVMVAWFATLGLLGLAGIASNPAVLCALSPAHALSFLADHGTASFLVLGSVVLAVTGGEALYADMGHFGRRAIKLAWLWFVLPCLVLQYFGQGALLLSDPAAVRNPFLLMAPEWAAWPLLLLATCATVIASQAVISGAFSLTQQAVRLGYLPRREIRHTSDREIGQVYIPRSNWFLLLGVVVLVVGFGSSSALASAYGISVTGAMAIDAALAFVVALRLWGWPALVAVPVFGAFLAADLGFLAANAIKIPDGGWFPLAIAAAAFSLMFVWRKGRAIVQRRLYGDSRPLEAFVAVEAPRFASRVRGTSVYMTRDPSVVPPTLLHSLKHWKVMHERVVLMTVTTDDVPRVCAERRVAHADLGQGFHLVHLRFGFMERPDVPSALPALAGAGLPLDEMETTYFLGRETLIPGDDTALNRLQEPVFMALSKTASSATDFFGLPPGRVVELGTQVRI